MRFGDILFLSLDTESINVDLNKEPKENWEIESKMDNALDSLSVDALGLKVEEGDNHDSVLRSVQVLAYRPEEWYADAEHGDFSCKPGVVTEMYKRVEIYTDKTVVPYFKSLIERIGKREGKTQNRFPAKVIAFAWNGEGYDLPVLNAGTHGQLWKLLLEKDPEPDIIADSANKIKTATFSWKLGEGKHSTTCQFMIVDSMKTYKVGGVGSLKGNAELAQPWVHCSAFYKTEEYDYKKKVTEAQLPTALPLDKQEAHYSKMDVVLQAGIIAYKSYLIVKDWRFSKDEVAKNGLRLLQFYWVHCFSATMVNKYTTDLTSLHNLPDNPDFVVDNRVNPNHLQNITGFKKHMFQEEESEEGYNIAYRARGGGQITINWNYWLKPIYHLYSLDDSSHYPYVMLTYPFPSKYPVEVKDPERIAECMKQFGNLTNTILKNRNNHTLLDLMPEIGSPCYMYRISLMDVKWHYNDRCYPSFSVEGKMTGLNIKTISRKLVSADYIDELILDYPSLCCLIDNYDFNLMDIKFYYSGHWIPISSYKRIQILTEGKRKADAKRFRKWAVSQEKKTEDVAVRIKTVQDEIDSKDLPIAKVSGATEKDWDILIKRVDKYYANSKVGLNALYGAEYQKHIRAKVTVNSKGELVIDNDHPVYTPKDQRKEALGEQGGHDYLCGMYTASWGRLIINTVGNYMYDISDNIRVCYQHTDSIKIASKDGSNLGMDTVDNIAQQIYGILPHSKDADSLGFGKFDNEKDHYAPVAMVFGHGQMITGGDKAKATWLGINLDVALRKMGVKADLSNLLEVLAVGQQFTLEMEDDENCLRTTFDTDCSGKYIDSVDMYTVPVIRESNTFTMLPNYEKTRKEIQEASL